MMDRALTYGEAIREATAQEMERDRSVFVFGLGVDDPKGIYGTTRGLAERFGPERVFDTPLSEEAMTGVAIGAALAGLRPVHVHIRMDFTLLAMNQIVNMAAKMSYMYGGSVRVPLVIRTVVGRSWGQGPQHSQALHSFFMHVPGLKVVAPTLPYDAKGALIRSIRDDNPVIFIEHRLLHHLRGPVPEAPYEVALGKARILAPGGDVTLVGISHMVTECLRAREFLAGIGLHAEVIDPVTLAPLDFETIAASAEKTRRLLVVDNGWTSCGAGAEILARAAERFQGAVRVRRLGFAPVPCPTTKVLQDAFYPEARGIASEACALVDGRTWTADPAAAAEEFVFRGPF